MAMFICSSKGETLQCWHLGEGIRNQSFVTQDDVYEVQADGHELVEIQSQFVNLPFNQYASVQIWYGDMAKFIVGNLNV